jgi:tetratricopeptide (TPR) repeat protein
VRLRGELLLVLGGKAGEAGACLEQALDLARAQSARSLELRIAGDLAALRGDAEARSALARVYGAFTEGFDTPDLRRASALLTGPSDEDAGGDRAPRPAPAPRAARDAAAELLERDEALATLAEARDAAARGEGRVVVVTGEPGIGKTSLVTRFVRELEPGARALYGTCDDLTIPRPLGPLRDLIGSVSSALEEALFTGAAPHDVQGLLIEELKLAPPPTMLVLEDVHWADDATLDTIAVLVRRIGSLPALLVLTVRAGEVPPTHPLHTTLGAVRAAVSVFLELGPLSERAVAALAGNDADAVYAATGGNPFYVSELLASRTAAELPASVTNAVLGRASRLDGDARRLVELVSVVPNRVSTALLDTVMPGWADAAVEPERRGLLEVDAAYVRFRHELARHAIMSSLPVAARRRLHAMILDAMIDAGADPSDVVHHAEAAGAEDVVAEYALVAARRAAALESNREAHAHYRRASDFVERLPAPEQAEILEELAMAAYLVGRVEEALPAIERTIRIHEDLGDQMALGRCTRILSRFHWYAGDGGLGRAKALEAIAILEPLGESAELARAYSGVSQLAMLADDVEQALEWGERALDVALRLGDESTRARALVNIGSARILQDHRESAALLEAHAVADAAGEREEAMRAYGNLGYTLMCWVQPESASRYLQQSLAYAREHEVYNLAPYFALNLAWLQLRAGEWDEAERAISVELERGSSAVASVAKIVLTELAIRRGDPDASERLADVTAQSDSTEDLQRVGPVLELATEWALTSGAPVPTERFERIVDQIRPRGTLSGCRPTRVAAWAALAGIDVDLDQPMSAPHAAMARRDWAAAAEAFGQVGWTYDRALMLSLLDDEESLREADRIAAGLGAEPLRGRVRGRLRELGLVERD